MKHLEPEKPVRRIWPVAMMAAGVLCCVPPLYASILSRHAKTLVEATLYEMDICEWPLIPIGIMLSYLAVILSEKRSKPFWAGIGCFVFCALIGLRSFFVFGTVLSCIGFIAALNDFPKLRIRRVMVGMIWTIIAMMTLPQGEWPTPRNRALRAHSLMITIAHGLEDYRTLFHEYPPSTTDPAKRWMWKSASAMPTFTNDRVTTSAPATYIDDVFKLDPFRLLNEERPLAYYRWDPDAYIMISAGPNCIFDIKADELDAMKPVNGKLPEKLVGYRYDPTNGNVSGGDIFIVGPMEVKQAP